MQRDEGTCSLVQCSVARCCVALRVLGCGVVYLGLGSEQCAHCIVLRCFALRCV